MDTLNPKTIIKYELHSTDFIELSINNILGQKLAALVNSTQAAGMYRVQWDASEFASGIYFVELRTLNFKQVRRMLLIK